MPEGEQPAVVASSNGGNTNYSPTSANIIMATIRPLNIQVLEDEEAVWVDGGVMTKALLDYLAQYITPKAPAGWTLGAFPWFVYQTLAGAIATASHGSSLTYNSLSHQILALEIVKADGSPEVLTPETHPLLLRAARVNMGQLGIVTRIKFRIVREVPIKRELRALPTTAFLALLKEAQESYVTTGGPPDWLDETEFFWITQRSEFLMVSFTRGDVQDPELRSVVLSEYQPQETTVYNTSMELLEDPNVNSLEDLPLKEGAEFGPTGLTPESEEITEDILVNVVNAEPLYNASAARRVNSHPSTSGTFAGTIPNGTVQLDQEPALNENASVVDIRDRVLGSLWELPDPRKAMTFYAVPTSAGPYIDISRVGVATIAKNATVEASDAYLAQPSGMRDSIRGIPYDQYEVAIPVTSMHDCMLGLMDMVYGSDLDSTDFRQRARDKGFRTAPLIRFIGKEDGLISYTYDGPRIFINIEDYLFYNQGRKRNERFFEVMKYLRSNPACGSGGVDGKGGGRLHFGKAGWPERGCWRGDLEYPEKPEGGWCSFACAVHQMDPLKKFRDSADDRWNFDGIDFDSCCGEQGFLRDKPGCECKVQPKRDPATCPPSPYYTDR